MIIESVKYASPKGSLIRRLNHWEPVRFGPYIESTTLDNVKYWAELEFLPAKKINKLKDGSGKKIDCKV